MQTYSTEDVKDGLSVCFDRYAENFETKRSNWFMRGFSKAIYLSRMSNRLYDIQSQIHKKRIQDT